MQKVKKGNLEMYFTDGKLQLAWSYDTCVMVRREDGKAIVNVTKYSPTTSKQMTCHVYPALNGEDFIAVKDVPINTGATVLVDKSYAEVK